MNEKRVVITGLGALTPLGNNVLKFWQNALEGYSGAQPITKFNAEKFKTRFACELKNFEPSRYLTRQEIKRSDLFIQYALYAASEAIEDAGIETEELDPFDLGVIWGSGQGGMTTFEEEITGYVKNNYHPRFSPHFAPKMITNMAPGRIAMKYGFMGINYATVAACATGNNAIMNAFNYIRLGKAKIIVAGGSESPVSEASIGGFNALKALSTRNEAPAEASRPFDKKRDGFVMGEGAGALILEEYNHAQKRNAHIYAELAGASITSDAYHMTSPHPEGRGAYNAMKLALEEARVHPDEIDYLNVHATSTPGGDISEIKAVSGLFGESPRNLSISATKSMTGHLLGAAGAVEAILTIKAVKEKKIPPTINTRVLDQGFPKDFHLVTNKGVDKEVKTGMSNAFGFGGHNSALVFKTV